MNSPSTSHVPKFWRDSQLPFIEARFVEDGRTVCYARHSHETFSIGAITAGQSTYLHEKTSQRVGPGTVVVMNPAEVHACNPIEDQPWSYLMLYVDVAWLVRLQQACGVDGFRPIRVISSTDPEVFAGLLRLHDVLTDPLRDVLEKHEACVVFFILVQQRFGGADVPLKNVNRRVERAAEYIGTHFARAIRLEEICEAASLSEAYLIRAFEQHYHMTPHAYLINRRVQHAQAQLRQGGSIADIAQRSGFADQAHLQRVFKKHLAATPGQYRR